MNKKKWPFQTSDDQTSDVFCRWGTSNFPRKGGGGSNANTVFFITNSWIMMGHFLGSQVWWLTSFVSPFLAKCSINGSNSKNLIKIRMLSTVRYWAYIQEDHRGGMGSFINGLKESLICTRQANFDSGLETGPTFVLWDSCFCWKMQPTD